MSAELAFPPLPGHGNWWGSSSRIMVIGGVFYQVMFVGGRFHCGCEGKLSKLTPFVFDMSLGEKGFPETQFSDPKVSTSCESGPHHRCTLAVPPCPPWRICCSGQTTAGHSRSRCRSARRVGALVGTHTLIPAQCHRQILFSPSIIFFIQ